LAEQEVPLLFRSLKFGCVLGIDIFLHWTMWMLPLFILGRAIVLYDPTEAVLQIALVFGIYVGLLLHMMAHLAIAQWVELGIRDVTLYPIGESIRLSEVSERPWKEIRVAIAGPIVYVVIALAIAGVFVAMGLWLTPRPDSPEPSYVERYFNRLFWLNLFLAILQVLPAFPMDGGRIFRGALALTSQRLRSTEVSSMLSSLIALLFLIFGMVWISWAWWMIAMGIIIHVSGQQELMTVRYFASLQMPESPLPTGSPILVPMEQLFDEETRPREPNFTGVTWNPKNRLWIVWRNGQPVSANALVGE